MYDYSTILQAIEAQAIHLYPRQILDKARPDYGAFSSFDLADGAHNAGPIAVLGYAFLTDDSGLRGDDELYRRIRLAIDFQRRAQRPSGLIDLCTTNWESAPDTGFTVQLLAPVVALSRKKGVEGDQRAAEIAEALGDYIHTAALGMIDRGFHTPNHRWVVCAALAQAMTLYPDILAMPYIESLLAETIDNNADGEYIERSTGVYSAICNRSLILMADALKMPHLLDSVRQNLNLMTHLFHHDGAVVTSLSNRQDRGEYVIPVDLAMSFFEMAQRDKHGVWASMADWLAAKGMGRLGNSWLLYPFIVHPEYRNSTIPRHPIPDSFSKFFSAAKIWRVRRGKLSATVAAHNTAPFALRYGQVNLKAVKIAGTYFATEQFVGDRFEVIENGVRMIRDGALRLLPGYDLPVGRPVPFDQFYEVRKSRDRWTIPPFENTLDIHEVQNGFDLHFKTEGGLDGVAFQIECDFEGPGEWETNGNVIQVNQAQTAILKFGHGIFRCGDDTVRIGPGNATHRMWTMRGAEIDSDAFRVLITFVAPVDWTLEIRYGEQLRPETDDSP